MKSYSMIVRPCAVLVLLASGLAQAQGEQETEEPFNLDDIIITAALEPLSARDVAASVTIITREQIEQRQVRYLGDLLRDVPGFNVSQSGGVGTQTQIRARGAEANHLLVLLDGVRANDPASGDEFQYQYALTSDIERIEIIRGPQSAIWGSDAVAGVVNIIRRQDVSASNVGGFLEGGSFGTVNAAVNGAYTQGGLKLHGGLSYFDTDGTNISREGDEKDGSKNLTLDAGLQYDISEAWELLVSGQHVDAETDFDDIDFVSTGLPIDANNWMEVERNYLNSQVRYQPVSSVFSGSAALNYSDSDNQSYNNGIWSSSTASEVKEIRLRGSAGVPGKDVDQEHRFSLGLDYIDTGFSQRGVASPWGDPNQDQSYDQTGLALQYVGRWFDGFTWTVSGRHNSFSDFDDKNTWQIAASHQVQENVRVRGSYGTGIKVPTFTERFGFFPGQFIGNPDLKPETSQGWEFGLETDWFDQQLVIGGAYFDQELENEIDGFVFDPETFLFTAANKDTSSDRKGFELTADAYFFSDLSLGASYTYIDATEDDFEGNPTREVRRPRHMASLNANYKFADNRGNVNANLNYTGEQLDVFFDPATFVSENVVLDAYTVVDLTGSWQLTPSLELVARINNLFDEDYEEVLGFARPGRGYYGGIRGRFGR